jgi:hypothetical protein
LLILVEHDLLAGAGVLHDQRPHLDPGVGPQRVERIGDPQRVLGAGPDEEHAEQGENLLRRGVGHARHAIVAGVVVHAVGKVRRRLWCGGRIGREVAIHERLDQVGRGVRAAGGVVAGKEPDPFLRQELQNRMEERGVASY